MRVEFAKMEGTGNDFVVIDGYRQPITLSSEQIRRLADRHYGVGCDQVLLVERPRTSGADFRYRIFNSDGSEVEQCGNGARCFARFVRERGLSRKDEIVVETLGGNLRPRLLADGQVTVHMGTPRFEPSDVPFVADHRALVYDLLVDGTTVPVSALSIGNPHAVQLVADVTTAPVTTQGPRMEVHPRFPRRVNVGYLQIVDRTSVRLRVWERGAGETLGCGSGACAAVIAGRLRGLLDETVQVSLPGGRLSVSWAGEGEPVWLTGPARTVFDGTIDLEAL